MIRIISNTSIKKRVYSPVVLLGFLLLIVGYFNYNGNKLIEGAIQLQNKASQDIEKLCVIM